jgi:hypothetical protein
MKIFPISGSDSQSFGGAVPLTPAAVRAACIALAIVLSSSVAFADPVRVITGFFGSGGDDTGLSLMTADVNLSTGALPAGGIPVVTCEPCIPGTLLNLSATVAIRDWGPGNATFADGRTFHSAYYGGSLVFNAGTVRVPDVAPQPPGLDETVPVNVFSTFTFTGTLNGFADPSLTGTPLFSGEFAGGGSGPFAVQAGFGNLGSGVFLDFVDYHFDDLAASPEPGSLLLFGSGVAVVAARRRKRRDDRITES